MYWFMKSIYFGIDFPEAPIKADIYMSPSKVGGPGQKMADFKIAIR